MGSTLFIALCLSFKFMCVCVMVRLVRVLEIALSADILVSSGPSVFFRFIFCDVCTLEADSYDTFKREFKKMSTKFILYTNLSMLNKYGEHLQNLMFFQQHFQRTNQGTISTIITV